MRYTRIGVPGMIRMDLEKRRKKNRLTRTVNRGSIVFLTPGGKPLFVFRIPRFRFRYTIIPVLASLLFLISMQLINGIENHVPSNETLNGNDDGIEGKKRSQVQLKLLEQMEELRRNALILRKNNQDIGLLLMEEESGCEFPEAGKLVYRFFETLCPGGAMGSLSFSTFYDEQMRFIPHLSPVPSRKIYITSGFGYRSAIFKGGPGDSEYHKGVDIRASIGDPVAASAGGIVRRVIYSGRGYGRMVELQHPSGYRTLYGHLSSVFVKKNQRIGAGETLGYAGNTGNSTGPHLHYEVRRGSKELNPAGYLVR